MSRTAHHVRQHHRNNRRTHRSLPALASSHVIRDLRYSARIIDDAETSGHRPIPTHTSVAVTVYIFPRGLGDEDVGYFARLSHRRGRHTARRELTVGRQVIRAALANGTPHAELDVDTSPPPRRDAIWHAG